MARKLVNHEPNWQPGEIVIDAVGNTKPGYVCAHELENGNGQCGSNTFVLDDIARLPHSCMVVEPDEPVIYRPTDAEYAEFQELLVAGDFTGARALLNRWEDHSG